MTSTDALDYLIFAIARAGPNDTTVADTTTRLGVAFANRDDGPELIESLCNAFYGARADLRYREQLALVMRRRN